MRTRSAMLLAVIALATCVPGIAEAATVVIGFEGTVTGFRSDEPLLDPLVGFSIGQPVSGFYRYENTSPGGGGDTHTSNYVNALSFAEVHVGSYVARAGNGVITIANDYGQAVDIFQVNTANTQFGRILSGPDIGLNHILQFVLDFDDTTATVFQSPTLPQGLIDLSRFDRQNNFLNFQGPSLRSPNFIQGYQTVDFQVTSLFLGPEPSSVVLAASGFVGFVGVLWRRRKRT